MAIIVPNTAERELLKLILESQINTGESSATADMFINFFKTNLTIDKDTLITELIADELTVDQYPVDANDVLKVIDEWSFATDDDGGVAESDSISITLQNNDISLEPYKIYGYFITKGISFSDPDRVLMWCEKFPSAFTIPATGANVTIKLRLELN